MTAVSSIRVSTQSKSLSKVQAPKVSNFGFGLFISSILLSGLLGGLVINTMLSHGQFEISQLRSTLVLTLDYQEALAQEVARLEAPEALKERAIAMGMVPGPGAGFIDLRDGRIIAPGIDDKYREADMLVVGGAQE
jgi:hypothetical protein